MAAAGSPMPLVPVRTPPGCLLGRRLPGRPGAWALVAGALLATRASAGTRVDAEEEGSELPTLADTPAPQPPQESLWVRWQRSTGQAMTQPAARGLFQLTSTRLDAYWRLCAFDGEPGWIDPQEQARARDLAILGASLGLGRALRDWLAQSEELLPLYTIASTASGASLLVELPGRRPEGRAEARSRPRLRLNEQPGSQALASSSITEAPVSRATPRPSIRLGGTWRSASPPWELVDEPLQLNLGAHVELRRLPLDAVRLELSQPATGTTSRPGQRIEPWSWTETRLRTTLRQRLVARTDLIASGSLRADPQAPLESLRAGLAWQLPTEGRWTLRPELRYLVPSPAESALPPGQGEEWIASLALQADLSWHLPQQWGRWPLGQEPGEPGSPPPTRR